MENPFLSTAIPVRWSALQPAGAAPAIRSALASAQQAIDAIVAPATGDATFEGTFLALENATEQLNATWAKISHLQSVADSPEWRETYNTLLPEVSRFFAAIPLNAALWGRLRTFAESPGATALHGVARRFLEETMRDFREAGADLPADSRARLEQIQTELASLTQRYSENVLDATNAWHLLVPPEEEGRLGGLPDHAKSAARESAARMGQSGWRFSLHHPSLEPLLTHVHDAELRRLAWQASAQVGALPPHDNTALVRQILALRAEKARLLGRRHFADAVLARRMAGSGDRALQFVADLQRRCAARFAGECRELEEFKAEATGGQPSPLAPWDLLYWSERLRRARHQFDEEVLRPFFPLGQVVEGLFEIAHRVFGIRITPHAVGQVETWHPDVRYYDLHDRQGRHLGSFYADWHPREAKRGGAWMSHLSTGGPRRDGTWEPHLGVICGNLSVPVGDRAALLSHREVETVFHEFGHLLHHLLGAVAIKSLNGINVAWDFVELPSQLLENWTWEREALALFARHHESGAGLPPEVHARMQAARKFRAACATMRQVAFARLDLLMHMQPEEFIDVPDVEAAAHAAVRECLIPTVPPAPTIVKRFSHLFGDPVGYAAGYYSYKWSEVLEADVFTRFQSAGIFNSRVGEELVAAILSRGNSEDPAELFRSFMGRDPDPRALLVRSGLE